MCLLWHRESSACSWEQHTLDLHGVTVMLHQHAVVPVVVSGRYSAVEHLTAGSWLPDMVRFDQYEGCAVRLVQRFRWFCAKPGACMTRIAGSTMDAMSDAIEGADVMLYGVSLQYKESANCRLEASCLCACRVGCIQPQRLTSSCSAGQLRPSTGAGHDPIDGAEGLLAEGMA